MVILINGAFGVGKTTVARRLRKRIGGGILFNPEWLGSVLMRLPRFVRMKGRGTGDFQDIELWRSLTARILRLCESLPFSTVIVPMTVWRYEYHHQLVAQLSDAKTF